MRINRLLVASALLTGALIVPLVAVGAATAAGVSEVVPDPGGVDMQMDLGQPTSQIITVTAAGTASTTFGTAYLSGDDDPYSIKDDHCSNTTVAEGKTCTITVVGLATTIGTFNGYLFFPSDSPTLAWASLFGTAKAGGAGTFFPTNSFRLLDTRSGMGAPKHTVAGGTSVRVQVAASSAIETASVSAVVLNLTATNGTAASYLTAYPDGGTRPTASSLNFGRGQTLANMVTVKVGADGYVDVYNQTGSVDVIADVTGFYGADDTVLNYLPSNLPGGQYRAIAPTRVLDTRKSGSGGALKSHNQLSLAIDFGASVNSHIQALVVNVTAVGATGSGYLSTSHYYPTTVSTLNFAKGATVPNMSIVPLRTVYVYNGSAGSVNVLVDIVGYYDDGTMPGGSRFFPIDPTRIADTRSGFGASPLHAGATATVTTPSTVFAAVSGGLLNPVYSGLDLNVTAVAPTASTYDTVWSAALDQPGSSNLNPAAGQTVANSVFTGFNTSGQFHIYNWHGTANMIVDVAGVFEVYPYLYTSHDVTGPLPTPTITAGRPTTTYISPRS